MSEVKNKLSGEKVPGQKKLEALWAASERVGELEKRIIEEVEQLGRDALGDVLEDVHPDLRGYIRSLVRDGVRNSVARTPGRDDRLHSSGMQQQYPFFDDPDSHLYPDTLKGAWALVQERCPHLSVTVTDVKNDRGKPEVKVLVRLKEPSEMALEDPVA